MLAGFSLQSTAAEIVRYVRYSDGEAVHYGKRNGDSIEQLDKAPWMGGSKTGVTVKASDVALAAPAEPSKVFAVGFNYRSHLDERELPTEPPIFLKLPTTIIGPGDAIIYPPGASNVHYEGELVVVIGKITSRVSPESAGDYIFGVTAGNDVSERDWQANDLQWFRGKASDTFGPIGPEIVTGLNYRDLLLQTRLNGKVVQEQRTRDQIHDVHEVVSFISQYSTLYPGDVIFTGTPGQTSAMVPGDIVEVEIENVGKLRNSIGTPVKAD
jgi:2-keto-4-pentenoate hydratase/2-oxohepta-3-ene-1,7-dioic acid hydratase in catechol pathway